MQCVKVFWVVHHRLDCYSFSLCAFLPCLVLSGQLHEVFPLAATLSSHLASSSSSWLPQTWQESSIDSREPCNTPHGPDVNKGNQLYGCI